MAIHFKTWHKSFLLILLLLVADKRTHGQMASDFVKPKYSEKYSTMTHLFISKEEQSLFFPDENGRVAVLLSVTDFENCNLSQFNIISRLGNIATAKLSAQEIQTLASIACVTYIDVSGKLNSARRCIDTTKILTRVDKLHNGVNNGLSKNYLGKNTIVGIVDVGFQNDHPTNYSMDGSNYRVKRFWHQSKNESLPPNGYSYGTEYRTQESILAARDDDGTHGIHVAGIAAGSGYTTPNNKYAGMAPESDMVLVSIKYQNDTLGGSAYGDYIVANPNIIDGYKYIFDYAALQGKPACINLSWGMHTGPHDGTSLFDLAVEQLSGPGKIIVGANGNDGGNQVHVSANLNTNDTFRTFAIDRGRADRKGESIYADVWSGANGSIKVGVTLLDTLGKELVQSEFNSEGFSGFKRKWFINGLDSMEVTWIGQGRYLHNQKQNVLVLIKTNNAAKQRIRMNFIGSGIFHAWNNGAIYNWSGGSFRNAVKGNDYSQDASYLAGTQNYSMGENGGTAKSCISVGSYVARKDWTTAKGEYKANNWLLVGEASGFSSRGPTPDGRIKPDISAPGQNIVSAVNNRQYAGWYPEVTTMVTQFNNEDQYWVIFSGTSMAAPHVCGIVALMLEADPKLSPTQVREILKRTAIKDQFTGAEDSTIHYGYGKVNAFGAVQIAWTNSSYKHKAQSELIKLFPNPTKDKLHFIWSDFDRVQVTVYDMTGRLLHTQNSNTLVNEMQINTTKLSPGTYSYSIKGGKHQQTGLFLVQ